MSAADLVIDIGNTRIKWALARDGVLLPDSHGARARADGLPLAAWRQLQPARVALASVADTARNGQACNDQADALPGGEVAGRIGAALERPVWRARSRRRWQGLVCAYEDPARFGVDRWLALLAARQRRPGATVLVVSAGTALTLDLLHDDGDQAWHRGGLIAPGLQAMQQGLFAAAPGLLRHRGGRAGSSLADNSADAIASGCLQAALGLVQAVRRRHGGTAVPVLLAGGDAGHLAAHLAAPVQQTPALVLEGLAWWLQHQPATLLPDFRAGPQPDQ